MLTNIKTVSEGKFLISPMTGTWILGVVNALFAALAYFAADAFGRKTLLVFG